MQKSMERLSSGLRINSAADDAAGLAVANKMESQLRGMNVAIRNSQDGISLVQTAESGMGEITNMIIRMRELSVQMNNGVYTDSDRANAQLEVNALLAEVDKIADNTAFNDVKVLDGSYSADIRAGNTNAEVINVTIDRMKTDTLGGNSVSTGVAAATKNTGTIAAPVTPNIPTSSKTVITAVEGDNITILASSALNSELDTTTAGKFAKTYAGGTFSLTGADAALFKITNASTGAFANVSALDFENPGDADGDNTYKFNVVYTQGTNVFTDAVELKITDSTPPTADTSAAGTTVLSTAETSAAATPMSFKTTGTGGILSAKFQEFAQADYANNAYGGVTNGGFSLTGADNANFSISSTGVITNTADLNFEAKTSHSFNVVYTNSNNVKFTEAVTLNVTNATGDAGSVYDSNAAAGNKPVEVASEGRSFLDITVDSGGSDGQLNIDTSTLLSADAQAYIAATTLANLTVTASTVDSAGAAAAGIAMNVDGSNLDVAKATTTGVYTTTVTLGGGTGTFTEVITLNVTQGNPAVAAAATAGKNAEATKSTTTLKGTSGGEAVTIDLTDSNLFADLANYVGNNAGGSYAIKAGTSSQTALADDFSLTNSTDLTLAQGRVAGSYSVTVEYTDTNNDKFTQVVNFNTTLAAEVAAAPTVTQTSTGDTSAATRTSTEATSGKSSLLIDEARSGTIKSVGTGAVLSAAFNDFVNKAHPNGNFTLEGTDAALFSIDKKTGDVTSKGLVDYENKTSYEITVKYTEGTNVYSEAVSLAVTDDPSDGGTHLADVDLSTQAGSGQAVLILDKALAQISSSQAKLGAIQNRLQHNIDNLSMASMLTETARGRVVDADFARETSELSKQQILGQAATSMLAQANQSKQSVLALLQ